MKNSYYNHAEYSRWYRQYNLNLRNFMIRLDALRLAMATLPPNILADSSIERQMDEIERKIEEVIPRDFDQGLQPLKTSELFVENIKVIYCVICEIFHIHCGVESIYEKERKRVLRVHHHYKFKERYLFAKKTLEELLAAYPQEISETIYSQEMGEAAQPMNAQNF